MNKELRKTAFCKDQESDSTNFIQMDEETINDLLRMFTVLVSHRRLFPSFFCSKVSLMLPPSVAS